MCDDKTDKPTFEPTFTEDKIHVEWRGAEIAVWNRLTVNQTHEIRHGEMKHHHEVLAGDGSTGETPEFITPAMDDKLSILDVYPGVQIIDPTDGDVTILDDVEETG